MPNEPKTTEVEEEKVEPPAPITPPTPVVKKVFSSQTVDFPSLGWGIHAGETLELPADEAAQAEILQKDFIKLIA